MHPTFRSYRLAVDLHRRIRNRKIPLYLRDQLYKASASVAQNLGEGSAKSSQKDRKRFYEIALGSIREVETIVDLYGDDELAIEVDRVARHVYRLCKALA